LTPDYFKSVSTKMGSVCSFGMFLESLGFKA